MAKKLSDFKTQKKNINKHKPRGMAMLDNVISTDGWQGGITVAANGETFAGSARLEVATNRFGADAEPIMVHTNGDRPVIIVRDDIPDANHPKAIRLGIADNRISEINYDADYELLAEISDEIDISDMYDDDELAALINQDEEVSTQKEEEDNDALEKTLDNVGKVESRVKLGEIWQLGRHKIACGDSTVEANVRALLGDRRFDIIFTDPPYGVNYEGGGFCTPNKREKLQNDDSEEIYTKVVPLLAKYCDGAIYTWFAGTKPLSLYQAVAKVGEIHALIIWHKTNATYAAMGAQYKQRHEPCLYWKAKGKTLKWCGASTEATVWEIDRDARNEYHPTQKPTALAEKAIGNHEANLIGDFFLGSGSTLIAAQKMEGDRTVYGFELSPDYCEVIIQRYENFTGDIAKLVGRLPD